MPPVDCTGAWAYQVGSTDFASVPSGCLSIRRWPSRQAPYDACVPPGYGLVVINGPRDEGGEDWVEVAAGGLGSVFVLVDYLPPW